MGGKKKAGGNTAAIVWTMVEPIAASLALSLWDVRFVKEGGLWFLRILIDKPGGVGIEDCEKMSRAIDGPLDEADPIGQAYCLEVSSPGICRELTRPAHYKRYMGAPVCVRLIRPNAAGEKELYGTLSAYEDGLVILQTADGEPIQVQKKDMVSVCLNEEDFLGG